MPISLRMSTSQSHALWVACSPCWTPCNKFCALPRHSLVSAGCLHCSGELEITLRTQRPLSGPLVRLPDTVAVCFSETIRQVSLRLWMICSKKDPSPSEGHLISSSAPKMVTILINSNSFQLENSPQLCCMMWSNWKSEMPPIHSPVLTRGKGWYSVWTLRVGGHRGLLRRLPQLSFFNLTPCFEKNSRFY